MADPKRQSTAATSKAATSKPGASSGAADVETLGKAIGARIQIKTSLPDHTIEGQIVSVCPITSLIAIKEADKKPAPPNPNTPATPNFRIMSVANIASYTLLSGPEAVEALTAVTPSDRDAMRKREADAIKKEKKKEADRGKGVSKEAQELYDFVVRTLPTRWNDKQIVVNDSVVIDPPYTVNETKAPPDKRGALPQIKKIVEAFWQKKKKTIPALPQGRKGG